MIDKIKKYLLARSSGGKGLSRYQDLIFGLVMMITFPIWFPLWILLLVVSGLFNIGVFIIKIFKRW